MLMYVLLVYVLMPILQWWDFKPQPFNQLFNDLIAYRYNPHGQSDHLFAVKSRQSLLKNVALTFEKVAILNVGSLYKKAAEVLRN